MLVLKASPYPSGKGPFSLAETNYTIPTSYIIIKLATLYMKYSYRKLHKPFSNTCLSTEITSRESSPPAVLISFKISTEGLEKNSSRARMRVGEMNGRLKNNNNKLELQNCDFTILPFFYAFFKLNTYTGAIFYQAGTIRTYKEE